MSVGDSRIQPSEMTATVVAAVRECEEPKESKESKNTHHNHHNLHHRKHSADQKQQQQQQQHQRLLNAVAVNIPSSCIPMNVSQPLPTPPSTCDIDIPNTGSPASSVSASDGDGFAVPFNFSMVCSGVYRSSFPKTENFEYLKELKLKSILTLVPEEYPEANVRFMKQTGIVHHQIGMPGNKEPFVNIPFDKITTALRIVLDKRNHPILIHCNKGKHRTGCIVGCLRKIQHWSLSIIFDEYRRFSHPKHRIMDEQLIELWDEEQLMEVARIFGGWGATDVGKLSN